MRTIGDNLKAHLAGDATTLCHCWRLTRRDGVVLGFTDHDRDLSFGGTLFRAESGYAASDIEAVAGLQAPSGEVAGALTSEAITEADIAAGRYATTGRRWKSTSSTGSSRRSTSASG